MTRSLVARSLILLLIASTALAVIRNTKIQSLEDGSVLKVSVVNVLKGDAYIQQVSIAPSSNITFNVTNVSSSTSFIIVQVHTYQYNVTLSYDKDHLHKISNRSVFGSNIGLYLRPGSQINTPMYLENDNVRHVDALIVAIPYNNKAPIPGGCNMEFNTEIAPYGRITVQNAMVLVDIQPSSVPLNDSVKLVCDKNPVVHEMYQYYLTEQDFSPEGYFVAIVDMLTVDDIRANGRQVSNSDIFSRMRRVFSAYTGTGAVYAAVATHNGYSAAYVPTFSYACSPLLYPESCQVLNDIFAKLVCAGCFFLGLFSVFLGNRCLVADMAVPIFFTGTMISYMCVVGATKEYDSSANIAIALGIGTLFAVAWTICYSCSQILATMIFTLTLGFFVASVAYFRSPDSFAALESNWIFWTLFCTFILMSLVMTLLFTVNFVITCSIYSSYMMVLPIDYYVGSALKYIVINVIRRATVDGFEMANVEPPVQTKDVCLIILWACLAIFRFMRQWIPGISGIPELMPLLP